MTDAALNLRRGADTAEQLGKERRSGFARTEYFGLKDGEIAILRFLTDYNEWPGVDMHMMVPTKPPFEGFKKDGNWPKTMSAVCLRTKDANGNPLVSDDCFICEHIVKGDSKSRFKAKERLFAIAVIRKEVKDPDSGVIKGYVDDTREVKKTVDGKDELIVEKRIVLVEQAYSNFYANLNAARKMVGADTVVDRDYVVMRHGDKLDSEYIFQALAPLTTKDGAPFDPRVNPDVAKRYETDLDITDYIRNRSSEDFYARFFDTRVQYKPKEGEVAAVEEVAGGEENSTTSGDVSPEMMQALRNRIMEGNGATAAEAVEGTVESNGEAQPAAAEPAEAAPAETAATGPVALD